MCSVHFLKVLFDQSLPICETITYNTYRNNATRLDKFKRRRLYELCAKSIEELIPYLSVMNNFNLYRLHSITATQLAQFLSIHSLAKISNDPNGWTNCLIETEQVCTIFTDENKSSEFPSVGSVCTCPQPDMVNKRSLIRNTSVFTAECVAINDALHCSQ